DPFMYEYDEIAQMSLAAIQMLNQADIKCTVLTKGILPIELANYSCDNEYGITLISLDEDYRKKMEPYTASYQSRLAAMKALHDAGCKTWVSIEPYPTPNLINQRLDELLEEISFTDKIIFGRTNYCKEVSSYKQHKKFPPVRFRLTSLTAGHFPTTEYIRCIIRRRNVFMKLEISIKFIDENGMEATKPVTVDTSVPDFDDFHDVNDFLLVFDQLEKAGLKLRNESFSTALAQYMETMSKKNCTDSKAPKRLPHT
ncbi:radical SAM protein, partial [uncultured Alistipes sp.]|uniref:radical SAM protein n=2 Tax=Bacteria TaxID=2 RepID=UPI00321F84C3